MGRGGRPGCKLRTKRGVPFMEKGSDESDEDYMVGEEEEFEASEDYCSSLAGDESEQNVSDFEEEQEKKVKKVARPRGRNTSFGRKKGGVERPRRRKRVSYEEDDDDEDYIGEGGASEFEDIEKEEEEKTDVIPKGRKNSYGRKKDGVERSHPRQRVSYEEDCDEDYIDDGGAGEYEDLEEEEEEKTVAISKGRNNSYGRKKDGVDKPRTRKRVSYEEDCDEDYFDDGGAGEFDDLEEEKEEKMVSLFEGQNNSFGRKNDGGENPHTRKRVSYREDDDEDYVNDGSAGEFEDEEAEEEKKMVAILKGRKNSCGRKKHGVEKPHTRKRVSYREDDDEDYDVDGGEGEFEDEEEEEEKKAAILKERKDFYSRKKDGVKRHRTRKRLSNDEEDYEDYNDEDYDDYDVDDDDDDEFMPDEIDCVDDEDELSMRKKKKKLSRPPSQGKGLMKRRKRKRNTYSSFVKKPTRKKPRKNLALGRKSAADTVEEFIDKKSVLRDRSKKHSSHRRKLITHYESDFVSSESSDFEYTVSEEERQQVREASEICKKLSTNLRSSSFSQNIREEEKVLCQHRKRLRSKGKEKVEELKNVTGKQVCGICLSEEGKKSVRGTLNCCSHYFCFDCIMEWSKVESRCPLCKQRFSTISKPVRSNAGFDLRTAVIQVPERDQVYQPSEEELRGYLDPYESVICTECMQDGNDALMLLCDLCDSPAHTYCVGLGHEVPEGNWYCEGCRPTAIGASTPQATNAAPAQRTSTNLIGESSPAEDGEIGFDLNVMYVPDTPMAQGPASLGSPGSSMPENQTSSPVSRAGAFTVSERRRIQRHIQHQIQHLINNRMGILRRRPSGIPATNSVTNLVSSRAEMIRELSYQPRRTSESATPRHTSYERRLHDNPAHTLQNRDLFSARLSHSRGHAFGGPTSTSTNASVNGLMQAEAPGINIGVNSRSSYEIHPCSSSRSNYVSDGTMPPYMDIEATVPSRTLQGPPRTPF